MYFYYIKVVLVFLKNDDIMESLQILYNDHKLLALDGEIEAKSSSFIVVELQQQNGARSLE